MKVWLSAQDFADLAAAGTLPGLPATKAGMLKLIEREGWDLRTGLVRARAERGGGSEYHIDNLPVSARVSLAARHFRVVPEDLRPPVRDDAGASPRARELRDAQAVILRLADRFRREEHLSQSGADALFAALFNAGSIELPAWLTRTIDGLSARTLARWRSRAGAPVFDPATARLGTGQLDRALDGAVRTFVLALIAKQPFVSARNVAAAVAEKFAASIEAGLFRSPSVRTLQLALKRWRAEYRNELMLLTDPDGYRSKVEFSASNVIRAERLNQIWMMDASPADVMLHEGRHSIYLTVDVMSRRTKIIATPTPRAAAVGLMMRKSLLAWGVPETVLTDNGSDFVAAATQRLFSALGIASERSQKYDPKSRGKGLVERPIGTFQRDLASLPGFIGHSVADRKKIEGRRAFAKRIGTDEKELVGVDMNLAEFQQWCDDWSDTIYATLEHDGLGGRTPAVVAAGWNGPVRRIDNTAALDILLAPVPGKNGLRTVTKTGVRLPEGRYLPKAVMPGTPVFCRMDPADLGRILLFEPDGEAYLGDAVCPELAGLDPVETIRQVKAAQKAHVDGRIKDIRKEMRRIGPRQVADAMRRQGEKRAAKLLAFPQRSATHVTPALAAAADAAAPVAPSALQGRAAELHAALSAAAPAADAPAPAAIPDTVVRRLPETREQRFRRALDLEARREAGEAVNDDDLLWLGGYREGAEYRAMRRMMDEFGRQALRL